MLLFNTSNIFQSIWDIILPPTCPICKIILDVAHSLCPNCWKNLQFINSPFCNLCAYPLDIGDIEAPICGKCAMSPLNLEAIRAALVYDDKSKFLMIRYKHGDELHLTPLFVKWLQHYGEGVIKDRDIILPVPLHPRRLLKRGYNQAALLAEGLSKQAGIPTNANILKRIHHTESQGHLNPIARSQNLKGAFRVSSKYKPLIKGQQILLIDDVMTSGATLHECAKVLKRAGAKSVNGLVVARAIL